MSLDLKHSLMAARQQCSSPFFLQHGTGQYDSPSSDYLFPHVVRGIGSYPLLFANNFTSGTTMPIIHLPNNFTPDYAIFPADFNTTVKAVISFPSSYGLLGTVKGEYPVLTGINSFQTQSSKYCFISTAIRGHPN